MESPQADTGKSIKSKAPLIKESPLSLECRVVKEIPLGSHNLFLAEVLAVDADESCMDKKGKFDLDRAGLIAYSHGRYFALGKLLGSFGYSVRKNGVHRTDRKRSTPVRPRKEKHVK